MSDAETADGKALFNHQGWRGAKGFLARLVVVQMPTWLHSSPQQTAQTTSCIDPPSEDV